MTAPEGPIGDTPAQTRPVRGAPPRWNALILHLSRFTPMPYLVGAVLLGVIALAVWLAGWFGLGGGGSAGPGLTGQREVVVDRPVPTPAAKDDRPAKPDTRAPAVTAGSTVPQGIIEDDRSVAIHFTVVGDVPHFEGKPVGAAEITRMVRDRVRDRGAKRVVVHAHTDADTLTGGVDKLRNAVAGLDVEYVGPSLTGR
jgi:hypothetical protein